MRFDAEIKGIRSDSRDYTWILTLVVPEYQTEAIKQLTSMLGDYVMVDVQLTGIRDDKRESKAPNSLRAVGGDNSNG